jgi:hypothetical protein
MPSYGSESLIKLLLDALASGDKLDRIEEKTSPEHPAHAADLKTGMDPNVDSSLAPEELNPPQIPDKVTAMSFEERLVIYECYVRIVQRMENPTGAEQEFLDDLRRMLGI